MQDNWDTFAVERKYIAIVSGLIKPKEKVLKNKLIETKTNQVFVNDQSKNGKEAITKYNLIKYMGKDKSLIDIEIFTGRKNQIRAQLDNFGYPIIGDNKYTLVKSQYNRLMLHAYKLVIKHPVSGITLELISRYPKEFQALI